MADNKAVGKTAGVSQEILDFLDLVAQYSGKDIKILDGKRDAATQAKRMYKYWTTTVDHGKVYVAGGSLTEANRQKLDADWETAHDDASDAAAKKTAELIPLCHPLALDSVGVDFVFESDGVRATATARLTGRTGVEMEAMTACSIALLTIYDMAKALDKGMVIDGVRLIEKRGGKSGIWQAPL